MGVLLYEVLSGTVTAGSRKCHQKFEITLQIEHVSIFGSTTDMRAVGSAYGADDRV